MRVLLLSFCFCSFLLSASPLKLVSQNFAPFAYESETGEMTGVLVDIIKQTCTYWQEGCNIEIQSNQKSKYHLNFGLANGNFPMGWNLVRTKTMWFSIPLVETEYGFFVRNSSDISSVEPASLASQSVGVFGPSNTQYSLESFNHILGDMGLAQMIIDVIPEADGQGLVLLKEGRYQAYYANRDLGHFRIKQQDISDVKYLGANKTLHYHIAFNRLYNSKEMIIKFNRLMYKLQQSGEFDEIYQRWNMKAPKVSEGQFKQLEIPF